VCSESNFATINQERSCSGTGIPTDDGSPTFILHTASKRSLKPCRSAQFLCDQGIIGGTASKDIPQKTFTVKPPFKVCLGDKLFVP
jgi:hypothetical protein